MSRRYQLIETPFGPFVGLFSPHGLAGALLLHVNRRPAAIKRMIASNWPDAEPAPMKFAGLRRAVKSYFQGKTTTFDVEIDLSGMTDFSQRVLEACRRIPYGRTAGYADLARAAGTPHAARAVGSVMARNPIALIIPCHRVVRSDGTIGGYSGPEGVTLKRRLLRLEGSL